MYSIVILPDENSSQKIIQLKQKLASHIGDFAGKDNLPHITLNYFKETTEAKLRAWQEHLKDCTQHIAAYRLCFDRIQNFSNGALVILAEEESNAYLKSIIKTINYNRPKGFVHVPSRPHISIARKLNAAQMQEAIAAIAFTPFTFTIHEIVLRKLEFTSGLYIILNEYKLPF
jgi:2'-5' RNA ligase